MDTDSVEGSFDAFVRARSHALGRAAYLLTGDVHLAEDLVQTALHRAAMRWERLIASGDPEAYVRRILYNEHVSWWRRRRLQESYGDEAPERAAHRVDSELRVTMRHALRRLTPSSAPCWCSASTRTCRSHKPPPCSGVVSAPSRARRDTPSSGCVSSLRSSPSCL